MSDRFFLDTNIFVYSFDKNAPKKAHIAERLIRKALDTGNGVVSYQVVQEFFNVALRRFADPMSYADAEQYLSVIFRPLLSIFPSHGLYLRGLHVVSRYKFSWYDSLIVAGAIEAQCAILFSEDFQSGQQFGEMRVENPFA